MIDDVELHIILLCFIMHRCLANHFASILWMSVHCHGISSYPSSACFFSIHTWSIDPTLPSVMGVSVTPTVQDSTPSLSVTWTALNDPSVSYSVVYSTTGESVPPAGAMMSGPTTQSALTLTGLTPGTVYHIWVAADANGLTRSYSAAEMATTFRGEYLQQNYYSLVIHTGNTN